MLTNDLKQKLAIKAKYIWNLAISNTVTQFNLEFTFQVNQMRKRFVFELVIE